MSETSKPVGVFLHWALVGNWQEPSLIASQLGVAISIPIDVSRRSKNRGAGAHVSLNPPKCCPLSVENYSEPPVGGSEPQSSRNSRAPGLSRSLACEQSSCGVHLPGNRDFHNKARRAGPFPRPASASDSGRPALARSYRGSRLQSARRALPPSELNTCISAGGQSTETRPECRVCARGCEGSGGRGRRRRQGGGWTLGISSFSPAAHTRSQRMFSKSWVATLCLVCPAHPRPGPADASGGQPGMRANCC